MNTTALILERPDMLESIRSETLQSVTTFLELEGFLGNSFVIQGGYFQLPEGPTTFSFQTARLACSLAGHLACHGAASAMWILLVNDIGINCGSGQCVLSGTRIDADQQVQAGCSHLGRVAGFDEQAVYVVREKVLRNRSLRLAKKVANGKVAPTIHATLVRPGVPEHPGGNPGAYYLAGRDIGNIILFEEADGIQTAKCPLIMAQLYQEMSRHAYDLAGDGRIVLLDFCRYADRDRVAQGYEVYQRLLADRVSHRVSLVSVCTNLASGSPAIFRHDPLAFSAGN